MKFVCSCALAGFNLLQQLATVLNYPACVQEQLKKSVFPGCELPMAGDFFRKDPLGIAFSWFVLWEIDHLTAKAVAKPRDDGISQSLSLQSPGGNGRNLAAHL